MKFELLVATRYLKAKRKQAVISVITLIAIVGIAAGVAALIIALAVTRGFREDLEAKLLGAQAHISVLPKKEGFIDDYRRLVAEIQQAPGVVGAAPAIYQKVLLSSEGQATGALLKGIDPELESHVSNLGEIMVEGRLSDLREDSIIIGKELSKALGAFVGDEVIFTGTATIPTPAGLLPKRRFAEVVGIFESGLYEYDSTWAYVPLGAVQRLLSAPDVVNSIDIKVQNIHQVQDVERSIAQRLDNKYEMEDWMMRNATAFQALKLERIVTFITIGLIVVVAALNIVAMLIMMVLEKTRDIAILLSMGARNDQIRRIFIFQGVIIGVIGTFFGAVIGEVVAFVADKYRLIPLAPDVYPIAYVPFHTSPIDTLLVAASAVLISFVATLYPSRAAAKLQPVEALRYE
jgi:lipoprotein-releasing system permease protein